MRKLQNELHLCLILVLFTTALLTTSAAADVQGSSKNCQFELKQQFLADHPQTAILDDEELITRIYGQSFAHGSSPQNSAQAFLSQYAGMFGITTDQLQGVGPFADGRHEVSIMIDRESNQSKFTGLYYRQHASGIPVFRSRLTFLIRNVEGYPLVLATANIRDLSDFQVGPAPKAMNPSAGYKMAQRFNSNLHHFTTPELVIWAGYEENIADEPTLAYTFIGDDGSGEGTLERFLFVTDATTGNILFYEDQIHDVDVVGNISAWASPDHRADACITEVNMPMPYARATIGANTAYADVNGDYVIPNAGTDPVDVNSQIRGQYFRVNNNGGTNSSLTLHVTPPGPADFVHNLGGGELTTAEVNAYIEANTMRDIALLANPTYPVIASQTNWPINVNLGANCNAYYNGTSINFYTSGGGCNNTAFGDVVHHEYGHHMVASGGSGQGAYGEGMSDVMGVIVTGRAELGIGFNSCTNGIRNADNTCQYQTSGCSSCGSEIHDCGQLISGCVWDMRENLQVTEPTDWEEISRDLAINSILLHNGSSITPAITVDFLTLDDDDGNLTNGTPHFDEINDAFTAHNMPYGPPAPPPVNNGCIGALPACPGTLTGTTIGATRNGASSCGNANSSPDVWYFYTPMSNGSATISTCGAGTTYDSVLSIHSLCPGTTANQLACDDDGCGTSGGPSTVTVNVTAGVTYFIRVTGWDGASGDFQLNITGPACNDTCAADLNGDGVVNIADLIELIQQAGPCEGCQADLNGDGVVNIIDAYLLILNRGPCP